MTPLHARTRVHAAAAVHAAQGEHWFTHPLMVNADLGGVDGREHGDDGKVEGVNARHRRNPVQPEKELHADAEGQKHVMLSCACALFSSLRDLHDVLAHGRERVSSLGVT